jgi:hypothetical protein
MQEPSALRTRREKRRSRSRPASQEPEGLLEAGEEAGLWKSGTGLWWSWSRHLSGDGEEEGCGQE